MSWQHPAEMTHREVFEMMRRLGIEYATVPYDGSHDESFVYEAHLYAVKPTNDDPESWTRFEEADTEDALYSSKSGLEEKDWLGAALMQPIYAKIGEAFGDSVDGVDGTCVWDATIDRVYIRHGFLDWQEETIEVFSGHLMRGE